MDRRNFISTILVAAGVVTLPALVQSSGRPLILGIFPRRNVKLTYNLFSPMAKYLSEQLGLEVKIETAKSFKQFWENVKQRRYDIVHFNQYHYIVSHDAYGYDVISVNKELGEATISGSLIVRKDSGINNILDLKGKTILFGGGKRAMQSYISATWLLRKGGLKEGDYIEKFAINPPNTLISTFFKRADASGSGDGVMKLDNVRKRIDMSQLKILSKTKPMVHLPWALKRELPNELKLKIQNLLDNLHNNSDGRKVLKFASLDALVPAKDSDFDGHRQIITDVYGSDYGVSKFK